MSAPTRTTALLAALVTGLSTLLLVAAPPSSAAPPANDNLADATPVSLAAGASTTLMLTTAEATKQSEAGEPTPCGSIRNTVWVAYTATDNQLVTAQTGDNTLMDTVLAVFTGTGSFPLVSPHLACNDDTTGIGRNSRVTFFGTAGTTYYLQVGHYGGTPQTGSPGPDPGPGPLNLHLTAAQPPPGDDVSAPITLGNGASGATMSDTTNATHASTDPPKPTATGRTLWYRWTAPANGHVRFSAATGNPTSPDTFLFAFPDTGATTMATALAYNDDVDEDGDDYRAAITFPVTQNATYRILAGTRFGHGAFTLSWEPASPLTPPANDAFAAATPLPGPDDVVTGNNANATSEPLDPDLAGTSGGHSVWYRWTAPADGIYDFATAENSEGSGIDTVLAVFTGATFDGLEEVVQNDNAPGGGTISRVRFPATKDTVYRILVDGWPNRTRDEFKLSWKKVVPEQTTTVITASPVSPGIAGIAVTVTRTTGGTPASGSVTISDGATVLGTLPLVGGTAQKAFRNQAAGSHTYSAVFTPEDPQEEAGSQDSAPPITIVARPRPANDDFASAVAITGTTGTAPYVDLFGASRQAGEPTLEPGVDGASVWYRWTAPATDAYTFSLQDDGLGTADPVIGIVRGTALDNLTIVRATSDPVGSFAQIGFSAIEGRVYYVMVDAKVPGSVSLSWSRSGGSTTTTNLIGADSLGAYKLRAEAEVTPVVPGTFVLLRDGAVAATAEETDGNTLFDLDFQRPGPSTVVVEFYPDDLTVRPSSSQSDEVTVVAPTPPDNDTFANAEEIEGTNSGSSPRSGTTYGATADRNTPPTALPSHADTSVWYRWVAPANGQFLFTVTRDDFPTDTVMRAFEGTTIGDLRLLSENDDADSFAETSAVGINAVGGRTYYLLVDAYAFSSMGGFTLSWETFPLATPTTTTLIASVRERVVTLTSTVDDPNSDANPVGYVEFFEGTTSRGTVRVTAASNRAVRTLTFVSPGVHTYRAVFVPDSIELAQSPSPNRSVTATKNATTTTLAAPTRAAPGTRPTVTATVRFRTLSTQPTGSVRFTLNGRVVGTVALRNGKAALKLPALAAGTARVVATYLGTSGIASSQATRSITVRR